MFFTYFPLNFLSLYATIVAENKEKEKKAFGIAEEKIKKIEAADYVAYLMYISVLLTAIKRIVEFAEQFQRGMTGIERFFEIIDTKPKITDSETAIDIEDIDGKIEFKNVTFRYSTDNDIVLKNINFDTIWCRV